MKGMLERQQVWIYFCCIALSVAAASVVVGTERLEAAINPALAFMLFVTFLQIPMAEIGKGVPRASLSSRTACE
jgi:ACR3 family arsenite transporter